MLELRLTDKETEALHKILETYLSDLREEIADTDSKDFRETLKSEELFIKELVHRLENASTHVVAKVERIGNDVPD